MDWGTLIGIVVGAICGGGATIVADRFRTTRDHRVREHELKSIAYANYSTALVLAVHELKNLRRHGPPNRRKLMNLADEVLKTTCAYEAREAVQMTSPRLRACAREAFEALRALRDCFDLPPPGSDSRWERRLDRADQAIETFKQAAEDDLAGTLRRDLPEPHRLPESGGY